MNPTIMLTLIVALVAAFAWSANRRWQLLKVGRAENRLDHLGTRLVRTLVYGVGQKKMPKYPVAGIAHMLIFFGFAVLLLRTLILWGRGFDPTFSLFVLGDAPVDVPGIGPVALGNAYEFLKDVFATLVLIGTSVFIYYRTIKPQRRMTLHFEGLLILLIIATMMLADMTYDGASEVLRHRMATLDCASGATGFVCDQARLITAHFSEPLAHGGAIAWSPWPSPAGSLFAVILQGASPLALVYFAHAGFWTHSALVLVFLNLLPHSKHFHVITVMPNVFASDITPPGRLRPMAENSEKLMEVVGAAAEKEDPLADPVGTARIEHFTWKAILDFYTCTECGRCSDNCPAHQTGKLLSPKHLTLDLRDHLYGREVEFLTNPATPAADAAANGAATEAKEGEDAAAKPESGRKAVNLVNDVIHPDVLWACTTCRACEEVCPVMISYVDKIVDMRRNLVLVRGEFPAELQKPFQGMEVNGNPWNLARIDRANWADGLGLTTMADNPKAPVLYWVGCAASYDDRAKKIARATARLLKAAGVDFAILGQEENCTGDPARRAGNEFLFATLAEQNAATLNGYKEQGGVRTILTTCPHCFNTLLNEYPDFGAKFEVVHHTDYLLGLLAQKKLVPKKPVSGRVVFHDSCYLGRYNDVYESPREILKRIPGVELVEAEMSRSKGLCCGAGGAQMYMEEQNKNRMNVRRTLQLVDTKAQTIASACPFCMTMLTDGLKSQSLEDKIRQLDVVELLDESCDLEVPLEKPQTESEPAAAQAD